MRWIAALSLIVSGCGGELVEAEEGDPQVTERTDADFVCDVPPGTQAVTTIEGLGMRSGPAADQPVVLFLPDGAVVSVIDCADGWYKVVYAGNTGWCSAAFLDLLAAADGGPDLAAPADLTAPIDAPLPDLWQPTDGLAPQDGAAPADLAAPRDQAAPADLATPRDLARPADLAKPPSPVDDCIARAKSGVGFSYHWGGGCWDPGSESKGTCKGSCPSCTHSGKWGADCSGFVAKVWQVPGKSALTTCIHPYSTYNFKNSHPHWNDVSRSKVKRGDAMVYNVNGSGHIFLFESGDGWGSMKVYEAKGCKYGIQHNTRTASSSYKAIRRDGY